MLNQNEVEASWSAIEALSGKEKQDKLRDLCFQLDVFYPESIEACDRNIEILNAAIERQISPERLAVSLALCLRARARLLDAGEPQITFVQEADISIESGTISLGCQPFDSALDAETLQQQGQRVFYGTGGDGLLTLQIRVMDNPHPLLANDEYAYLRAASRVATLDLPQGHLSVTDFVSPTPLDEFSIPPGRYNVMTFTVEPSPNFLSQVIVLTPTTDAINNHTNIDNIEPWFTLPEVSYEEALTKYSQLDEMDMNRQADELFHAFFNRNYEEPLTVESIDLYERITSYAMSLSQAPEMLAAEHSRLAQATLALQDIDINEVEMSMLQDNPPALCESGILTLSDAQYLDVDEDDLDAVQNGHRVLWNVPSDFPIEVQVRVVKAAEPVLSTDEYSMIYGISAKSFINLPTGKLCVTNDGQQPAMAEVQVPAGNYFVINHLLRLDENNFVFVMCLAPTERTLDDYLQPLNICRM